MTAVMLVCMAAVGVCLAKLRQPSSNSFRAVQTLLLHSFHPVFEDVTQDGHMICACLLLLLLPD